MKKLRSTAAVLLGCLLLASCTAQYRVYDPYRGDYHYWDAHEDAYYHQWAHDTHHDNRDYKKLNTDEQKQYWTWRHQQPEGKDR